MHRSIELPEEIEPLVRFVEETPPEEIVEKAVEKLTGGIGVPEMMRAVALAVIRSTEMPYVHHGGPLHPVAALHAVGETMRRLPEDTRLLPLIQDVALANAHIHDPASGPYIMPRITPVGEGSVEATVEAFYTCQRRNYPNRAEHYFLWLLENAPREVALEALLRVAVANYRFDEHKTIAAVNGIRLLDALGWSLAPVVLRPVVRYNFMPSVWANAPSTEGVEAAFTQYGLSQGVVLKGEDPGAKVDALQQGLTAQPSETKVELIARALAEGMSAEGVGEAISLAASASFVQSPTTNPMGIHPMTGCNALRWVCRKFPAVGIKGLLLWALGPETQEAKQPDAPVDAPSGSGTLEMVAEAVEANDPHRTVLYARAYCREHEDLSGLVRRLGEWAAMDSATEMHGMKHHQAMVEEFATTRPAAAGTHLVAQAKEAALHVGKGEAAVHLRALEALRSSGR